MSRAHDAASIRIGPRMAYLLRNKAAASNRSLRDLVMDALARSDLFEGLSPEVIAYASNLSDEPTPRADTPEAHNVIDR